jgi:hypothetical protein
VLGTVGLAIGTFTAAYAGTRWLADSGISKGLNAVGLSGAAKKWDNWSLGGSLYDMLHGSYDPNAPARGSRFVAPRNGSSSKPAVVNMMLDGRKVGQALLGTMANDLSAPLGGANFDGSLTLAPVVLNQAH